MSFDYEAIVIGSGFGGAIASCRLSKKWPNQVLLVERGKRYPLGSFPRSPAGMADNFFNIPGESIRRPKQINKKSLGMFDVRSYHHIDVVQCAGLGGGSLIYANVFMEPPAEVFDQRWPSNVKLENLKPYYQATKYILGARTIPQQKEWHLKKVDYFQKNAEQMGRKSKLVDIMVYFGNEEDKPLPKGIQDKNRYGAVQTSCTYCAECDVGCNTHSKNTLDLNYIFVAENQYGLSVHTEHKATKIIPLNSSGNPDSNASGCYGFEVEIIDLVSERKKIFRTQRIIVSAGTLGSNELLLKNRDEFKTLPNISKQLGKQFSGNGDFLSFVINGKEVVEPTVGPVITQRIDYNLFEDFNKDRAFIMEDASYPNFLAWYVEGSKPDFLKLRAFWESIKAFFKKLLGHSTMGRMGNVLSKLLSGDESKHSSVHLCMGYDQSDGIISLNQSFELNIDWFPEHSMKLYDAINDSVHRFGNQVEAKINTPLPTWFLNRNVTVHPLGGCHLSADSTKGVTKSEDEKFGELHHYENIYVCDGALFPSAVGANPAATIAALAEKVSEGITKTGVSSEL